MIPALDRIDGGCNVWRVNDVLVIPQGALVVGTVTQALARRRMGRTGKPDFSIDKVWAVDGKYIPMRYTMLASAFLLMKGKDVTLHKGVAFEVFTDSDFKMSPPAAPMAAPSPVLTAGVATVHITSDVPGADVEVMVCLSAIRRARGRLCRAITASL